jgi:hypothetical protein
VYDPIIDHGVGMYTSYVYGYSNGEPVSSTFVVAAPQNSTSDCGRLVDELVKLAVKQPRGVRSAAKVNMGRTMGYAAKNRFGGGHGDPNLKVGGFQQYLIAGGQGADVYKHVYGVAGAVLIGNRFVAGGMAVTPQPGALPATTGWGVAYSQLNADKAQMNVPNHHNEAVAEVADDYAGIDIGKWMGQSIDGTLSQDELRKKVFNRLCDY